MSNFDKERYSVCIGNAETHGENTYHKFYRVADYIPEENPDELVPAIVKQHVNTQEEAQANPDHLYNPSAVRNYDSRESDIYLLQWRQDPNKLEKQLTRSFHDDVSLLAINEVREVIVLEDKKGETGLRDALSEGIPFSGKTTSVFYIVYGNENGKCPAIRCERRDFSFAEDKIQLRYAISNTKDTLLSAPRVWLEECDIIESPHVATSFRKIYAKLNDPEVDGRVLLRSLNYFASDYVKWFIRKKSIQVSKSERRTISKIIDTAFSRPEALEKYLEAGVCEDEIQGFKRSLSCIVMDEEDPARMLFRTALLEDEGFYRECVEQVMQLSDELLEERKNELTIAKSNIDDAQSSLNYLSSEIDDLNQRKQSLEGDIKSLSSDVEQTRIERDEVLREIQSNIALKLGLRTVASSSSTTSGPGLMVEEGFSFDCTESDSDFKKSLLNNLKRFGVTSVVGEPAEERDRLVTSLISAIAATRFIAVPQSISRQVADSVSLAISGHGAKRVVVPADCRDISSVLGAVSGDDDVVLVEGVIDAVNEGMLFSLLSKDVRTIVIFSFMSHASATLVSKEVWGKLFLPYTESLLVYPCSPKDKKLYRATFKPDIPVVRIGEARDKARDLNEELESLGLAAESLLLTATVFLAVEGLVDEDIIERYVAQHLFMCSRCDGRAYDIVNEWSEEDLGLLELAKRLGVYES